MSVQSRSVDVVCGRMFAGGEAVLGPASFQLLSRAVPVEVSPEMAVDRQKSQEGSGVLCVKVITDGPTRVLQITDVTQQVCRTSVGTHIVLRCSEVYPHSRSVPYIIIVII